MKIKTMFRNVLFVLILLVLGLGAVLAAGDESTASPPASEGNQSGFAVPSETSPPLVLTNQLPQSVGGAEENTPTGVGGEDVVLSPSFGDWWVTNGEDALQNLIILALLVALLWVLPKLKDSLPVDARENLQNSVRYEHIPMLMGSLANTGASALRTVGVVADKSENPVDDVVLRVANQLFEDWVKSLEDKGLILYQERVPKINRVDPLQDDAERVERENIDNYTDV